MEWTDRKLAVIGCTIIATLLVVVGQADKATYLAIGMMSFLYGDRNGYNKAKKELEA